MDFSTYCPEGYSTLTTEHLQAANNGFALNGNLPPGPSQPCPGNNSLPQANNNVAQLQQNMFFLDPFETNTKVDPLDQDHASYSSMSPVKLFLIQTKAISTSTNSTMSRGPQT
jgi:hypothetical protein